jgi:hypothetical protein
MTYSIKSDTRLRPWAWAAMLAALLLVFAPAAGAATPTPVTCSGLQTAVNSATAGEVLQLPAGLCATDLTITNTAAFTLEGATGGVTTLTPTALGNSIIKSNASVTFTLSGLTLTGTRGAGAVLLTGIGEAVTIEHDSFTDDAAASGFGGAVSLQPSSTVGAQPTVIEDNTFTGDSAYSGGAVFVIAAVSVVVSGNTFTGNVATVDGGALSIGGPPGSTSSIQVTGNTFGGSTAGEGNTATNDGGAIFLQAAHAQPVTLSSNVFEGNAVTGSHTAVYNREGGAVFMSIHYQDTPFTVTQSHNTFSANSIDETQAAPTPALGANGGAEWLIGVDVNSTGDVFVGNRIAVDDGTPPEGGALGAFASPAAGAFPAEPAVFTGTNDLFMNNSTAPGGWGGAIYAGGPPLACTGVCPGSTVRLYDSTVVGNRVDAGAGSEGGAIWGSPHDNLALRNSIVSGNTPQPELWGFGTTSPVIAYTDACNETGGTAVPPQAGNICANPELTLSGVETSASPTLDAGSNALVPAGVTTDLAGNSRIVANRLGCYITEPAIVDMGAFEFTGHSPAPPCAPRVPPLIRIGRGPLHDKHGRVSVRLTCARAVSYCTGELTLSTRRRHSRRLGKHSFKIAVGRSTTIKLKVSKPGFGKAGSKASSKAGSVPVVVAASVHDKSGRRAKAHRNLTLLRG